MGHQSEGHIYQERPGDWSGGQAEFELDINERQHVATFLLRINLFLAPRQPRRGARSSSLSSSSQIVIIPH